MFSRSFMSYFTFFSLSAVGFAPVQADDAVMTTALQLKQSQQRNRAFLDQVRNTPRLSDAEIAALSKADQAKYRTMRSSLDVLIQQLEALEAENVGLGNSIQAATMKNSDLDKKIDALRPAALQSTMNRAAMPAAQTGAVVNPTVTNPAAINPAAATLPRFANQAQPTATTPSANAPTANKMSPMVPAMPPSNTN